MSEFISPLNKEAINCSFCCINCCVTDGLLKCKCGQKPNLELSWKWDDILLKHAILVGLESTEIFFHPTFSGGTSVARGNEPFIKNHLYYYEIKVLTSLFGTDMMIGVGLENMPTHVERFESLLGKDEKSWGFSYRGYLQHDSERNLYGKEFGYGSIIGVFVNMRDGTLEYFLNRQSLGKAFDGLKNHKLYPMVCSTSSNTLVRLTAAVRIQPTLQFLCSEVIRRHDSLIKQFEQIPGLLNRHMLNSYWDLVAFQDTDDEILTMDNLSTISEKIACVQVFGYSDICHCPKVVKKMLIHNFQFDSYWSLDESNNTIKDYWSYNSNLLKSDGCIYRNFKKVSKFTKLTYVINKDKHSIVFDTNETACDKFFILKQCERGEFYPCNMESVVFNISNEDYVKFCTKKGEYNVKLLLESCNCERLNESNDSSNDSDNSYKNMEIVGENFMCNGNGTYSIDLTLYRQYRKHTKGRKRKCTTCNYSLVSETDDDDDLCSLCSETI